VLPKGTIVRVVAWHDNIAANPNNPGPNQWVGDGDRIVDEMAHAWVNVTYLNDEDTRNGWPSIHRAKPPARAQLTLYAPAGCNWSTRSLSPVCSAQPTLQLRNEPPADMGRGIYACL
jgi:hypothetical protein